MVGRWVGDDDDNDALPHPYTDQISHSFFNVEICIQKCLCIERDSKHSVRYSCNDLDNEMNVVNFRAAVASVIFIS